MGAKLGADGGPMADINVTPLIDVVLVLLVVFMVVTPLLQSGLSVDLPVATQSTTVNDVGQHITVSITSDRGWWVEQERVRVEGDAPLGDLDEEGNESLPGLVAQINTEFRANPERSILVKADRNMKYGDVREALDVLAENRLTTVFVATNKE